MAQLNFVHTLGSILPQEAHLSWTVAHLIVECRIVLLYGTMQGSLIAHVSTLIMEWNSAGQNVSRVQFWIVLPTGSTGGKEVWWVFSDVTEEKRWEFLSKGAFISLGDQRFLFVLSTVNDKMRSRLKTWFDYTTYAITECHLLFIELCKLQGHGRVSTFVDRVNKKTGADSDSTCGWNGQLVLLLSPFSFPRTPEVKFQKFKGHISSPSHFWLYQCMLGTRPPLNTM